MKPKTARRHLSKMEKDLGRMIHEKGKLYAADKLKPYMLVLAKDKANPASARIRNRIRRVLFE